jgi:Ulp1 family protease
MFSELRCRKVFATVIVWLEFAHGVINSKYSVDFSEWDYSYANNSQQQNGYDCGLYVLRCFESYTTDQPMAWNSKTFVDYRALVLKCLVSFLSHNLYQNKQLIIDYF